MLKNVKECGCTNFDNTNLESYNVDSVSLSDYNDTIEFRTIKELINEEHLEYVTEYLRALLKIQKPNNPNCFQPNKMIHSILYKGYRKRVIIYVRLSVEDLEKTEGNVSKSILNQLLMLLKFCKDKEFDVVGIFYEEDISGGDGDRIEWNKSLLFCELGNTDIYVCKTQARFARSIEFVEKYLHKNFIEWNIRFLSIVDNIDTDNKGNKKSSQITAMADEWKIEEQSVNTKKTLRSKNDAGQWTGSFAPFGYIEDPNDMYHFVIDEPAAKIVREIYEMYANGKGYRNICFILNERKVPTPSKYKKLQGSNYVCPVAPNGAENWCSDTVRKILMDETYDGVLIQHRTESISYNIKGRKKIPKAEQSIVACAHDRIVDPVISKIVREKFAERKKKKLLEEARVESNNLINAIQESLEEYKKVDKNKLAKVNYAMLDLKDALLTDDLESIIEKFNTLRESTSELNSGLFTKIQDKVQVLTSTQTRSKPDKNGEIHIFSRKVYCKCCGKSFQKNKFKSGPRKNYTFKSYLQCRTKYKTGVGCDNKGSIRSEVLEEIVLNEINKQIEKYYNQTKLEKSYYEKKVHSNYQKDIDALNKEKVELEKKINSNQDRFSMLYEDKASGVITAEEFVMLKSKYQNDTEKFKGRVININAEILELENKKQQENNEKTIFEKYKTLTKLDRIVIDTFISKIIIGKVNPETQKRDIKIIWNICI